MQSDRELLEAAAKAAGLSGSGTWDDKWGCLTDYEGWTFDPLNDDGDSLRLFCALRGMRIETREFYVTVNYCGQAAEQGDVYRMWAEWLYEHGGDIAAATRRAIVRAAADIGSSV